MVGWQTAQALAYAHAAACGDKAHADGARRFNAVVQRHAVGVDVEVVAAGGAAAHQQLGHGHLGAGVNHVGREAAPNRVQPLQPAKQLGVLHRHNRPRERLVHMVVGVDHARHHQVLACVDHGVGGLRQGIGRTYGGNQAVAHQN